LHAVPVPGQRLRSQKAFLEAASGLVETSMKVIEDVVTGRAGTHEGIKWMPPPHDASQCRQLLNGLVKCEDICEKTPHCEIMLLNSSRAQNKRRTGHLVTLAVYTNLVLSVDE
jgi:hypothetical protein